MHFAAANGHAAVVQLLLACGAVPDKPDKHGMTPEDLANMSGHSGVVHTIRVWRQMNGLPPPEGADQEAGPSVPSGRRHLRSDSGASSTWTGSESDVPTSRKGRERAQSVASMASEKSKRLFRGSFTTKQQPPQPPPSPTPQLKITTSSPSHPSGDDEELPSPFNDNSPMAGDEDETAQMRLNRATSPTDSTDTEVSLHRERSSRRPSLPSIIEKAAHPGAAFRAAIRKTEESSPSIDESSPPSSPAKSSINGSASGSGVSLLRGRSKHKHAIMGLFRRGQSPHSRSPSPPRKTEKTQPIDVEEVDANVARLKRASMDPELMRMAMEAVALSDRLEGSTETTSAPVTKTRFFDESPRTSSSMGFLPSDRVWEHRRKGSSGVISPSPLANEWGANDEGSPATVRRARTEVRRVTPSGGYPRRMPSEPHLAAARLRSNSASAMRAVSDPASASSTPVDSPMPGSDADDDDDEDEDEYEDAGNETLRPPEEVSTDSESTIPSTADVPSLTLDTPDGDSEVTSSTELRDTPHVGPDVGRFRGESIGSATTDSSRGLRTPPSMQVMTPPGSGKRRSSNEDDVQPGKVDKRGTRSRGHSVTSIGSGFPPVPEHEVTDSNIPPRPPVRKISSHAEAKDIMEQAERDVLELAQMPATADSSRSLADQLAAYGDSHDIAEEFARQEKRVSSLSSGSDRASVMSNALSDHSSKRRQSSLGSRHSRMGSSPSLHNGLSPSIAEIYDRRDKAYRDRLNSLSATPIYGLRATAGVQRSRTVSGETRSHSNSHSRNNSDSWMNAGPDATLPSQSQRRSTLDESVDSHPHISGPLPLTSDKPRRRPSSRSNLPSSLKSLTPIGTAGGLARSVSLTRPNDDVNTMRFQGLAQARVFAAAAAQANMLGPKHAHLPGDGHDSDDEGERGKAFTVIENDWRGGHVVDPPAEKSRWGAIKGRIGHLRR